MSETPTTTYLGVSPPVRSGAANPLSHDRSWTKSAYSASHSNLQALRELDSAGEPFLRARSLEGSSLLLGSPEAAGGPLAEAASVEWRRAGSNASAAAGAGRSGGAVGERGSEYTPFTCRTEYFPIA